MTGVVLDASAVLAVLFNEAGAERIVPRLRHASVSAVTWADVLSALRERGVPVRQAVADLRRLRLPVLPFDDQQAAIAAEFGNPGLLLELSLADRACLALARSTNRRVLTTHQEWTGLDIGIPVECVR